MTPQCWEVDWCQMWPAALFLIPVNDWIVSSYFLNSMHGQLAEVFSYAIHSNLHHSRGKTLLIPTEHVYIMVVCASFRTITTPLQHFNMCKCFRCQLGYWHVSSVPHFAKLPERFVKKLDVHLYDGNALLKVFWLNTWYYVFTWDFNSKWKHS